MDVSHIVLASHGTAGARAAERAAFDLARRDGARVTHLYVIPDFWAGMRGDDWLNNAVTQEAFGHYLEGELAREAREVMDRLQEEAQAFEVALDSRALFGDPTKCLIHLCADCKADLVVLGTPRPKGMPGYASRMKLDLLSRSLGAALLIVPPDAKP